MDWPKPASYGPIWVVNKSGWFAVAGYLFAVEFRGCSPDDDPCKVKVEENVLVEHYVPGTATWEKDNKNSEDTNETYAPTKWEKGLAARIVVADVEKPSEEVKQRIVFIDLPKYPSWVKEHQDTPKDFFRQTVTQTLSILNKANTVVFTAKQKFRVGVNDKGSNDSAIVEKLAQVQKEAKE
jgi:hypothetical protein